MTVNIPDRPTINSGSYKKIIFGPKTSGIIPRGITFASVVIIFAMLAVILFDIFLNGAGIISWDFLSKAPEEGMSAGGIFPAIFGTVALVILMVIAVVPIGVLTAVYLHEYTSSTSIWTRLIRQAINNLAGVPSIVFGLFGLGFFINFIGGALDEMFYDAASPVWRQPGILWAALTLSLLTLPVVIISTEEALRTIPQDIKDASLALGATKLQTIKRVILPQAMPGILTGAILAVNRGAGEVAPIMFTGVAYFLPYLPHKLNEQFMHLGNHVYVLATQSPDVEETKPLLYGTVLVLLILTFMLNFTAILLRSKMRRRRVHG